MKSVLVDLTPAQYKHPHVRTGFQYLIKMNMQPPRKRRITWSQVFLWKITHLRHDLSQMTLNTGDQVQRCFWLNFVTPPSPAPHPHFPFFVENISKKFMFSHYMCVLYFVFCILCVFIFTTPLSSLTLLHQHQQRICHKTVPCTCCLL